MNVWDVLIFTYFEKIILIIWTKFVNTIHSALLAQASLAVGMIWLGRVVRLTRQSLQSDHLKPESAMFDALPKFFSWVLCQTRSFTLDNLKEPAPDPVWEIIIIRRGSSLNEIRVLPIIYRQNDMIHFLCVVRIV